MIDRRDLLTTASAFALLGPGVAEAQTARPADTDWLHYANDASSTRYSPLDQINAANFDKLELAWRFSTNALGPRLDADYQSTPLVVKGRLYCTAGFRRDVVCLDAGTGELCGCTPMMKARGSVRAAARAWASAIGPTATSERIVYVTRGYSMFSLDAKTGLPDPNFGDGGRIDLRLNDDQVMDPNKGVIGLHAPPFVVKDTVVVGAAPTVDSKGYVRGFDIKTGKRKWIFHTIPRKGEFGYDTWTTPGQAEAAGNTGSWAPMSADPELGLVYVGVELPQTDTLGRTRTGPHPVRRKPGGAGHRDRCAQMALPDDPSRPLGPRRLLRRRHLRHPAQRQDRQGDRPADQAGLRLCAGSRHRQAGLADPGKESRQGRCAGRMVFADPAHPQRAAAFRQTGHDGGRSVDWTPQIKARALEIASHYHMGPLYDPPPLVNDKLFGGLCMPGLQGGINWPGASYDPDTNMLYLFAKNEIGVIGARVAQDGKVVPSGGPPAAGSADANGGSFGGVASLKGATGIFRGSGAGPTA